MEIVGILNSKEIYYLNIRNDNNWFEKLPIDNWCAFTITNIEDADLVDFVVSKCLDKSVIYTCSAGQLAETVELSFDLEIVKRAIEKEEETKIKYDYENSAMTTVHKSLEEALWFAGYVAVDNYKEIKKIICINFTNNDFKDEIVSLTERMNTGWIPENE